MSIVLCATESLPLDRVVEGLRDEGLDVFAKDSVETRNIREFEPSITKGVLIVPRHGAADPTQWFRGLLGPDRPLILCAPQPDKEGYEMLSNVGATEIITPRSWVPEHITERILGQLILDGEITRNACGHLRGATQLMRNAYERIAVLARVPDHVLIMGETGTGKELFAREIHNLSRGTEKFVALNCAGLSFDLASSELFGHGKGSFTGATDARQGLLAEAGRGTVFLDEIGELDFKTQGLLLRLLDEKKYRRLGSNKTEDLLARIVLATNRDLEVECTEKRFRHDVFERIRGFTLELEPLRERRGDIPLMAEQFLAEFNRDTNARVRIPPGALDCLFDYEWPGNVRELRAALRLAAAFGETDGFLDAWELKKATRRRSTKKESAKYQFVFDPRVDNWKQFLARGENAYLQALLDTTGGDKKEAQVLSGIGKSQFYTKLKSMSMPSEDGDKNDSAAK